MLSQSSLDNHRIIELIFFWIFLRKDNLIDFMLSSLYTVVLSSQNFSRRHLIDPNIEIRGLFNNR